MSAVDVLAVMDATAATIGKLGAKGLAYAADLREARAAVAEAFAERDELIARRQQDMAILDAIRDAVGGGPYDTIATRVAELIDKAETAAKIIANAVTAGQIGGQYSEHASALLAALARVQGGQS